VEEAALVVGAVVVEGALHEVRSSTNTEYQAYWV
jgi:hypothetical protein